MQKKISEKEKKQNYDKIHDTSFQFTMIPVLLKQQQQKKMTWQRLAR